MFLGLAGSLGGLERAFPAVLATADPLLTSGGIVFYAGMKCVLVGVPWGGNQGGGHDGGTSTPGSRLVSLLHSSFLSGWKGRRLPDFLKPPLSETWIN